MSFLGKLAAKMWQTIMEGAHWRRYNSWGCKLQVLKVKGTNLEATLNLEGIFIVHFSLSHFFFPILITFSIIYQTKPKIYIGVSTNNTMQTLKVDPIVQLKN